jgi:hypothetical protein
VLLVALEGDLALHRRVEDGAVVLAPRCVADEPDGFRVEAASVEKVVERELHDEGEGIRLGRRARSRGLGLQKLVLAG